MSPSTRLPPSSSVHCTGASSFFQRHRETTLILESVQQIKKPTRQQGHAFISAYEALLISVFLHSLGRRSHIPSINVLSPKSCPLPSNSSEYRNQALARVPVVGLCSRSFVRIQENVKPSHLAGTKRGTSLPYLTCAVFKRHLICPVQ